MPDKVIIIIIRRTFRDLHCLNSSSQAILKLSPSARRQSLRCLFKDVSIELFAILDISVKAEASTAVLLVIKRQEK